MIHYTQSTIFNVGAQGLVNTINTVGKMGAGIALEFALRYPEMNKDYVQKCEQRLLKVGKVYYYPEADGTVTINFPTKAHYAYPSKLIWIEQGLQDFAATYEANGIQSVAFPKLGCSNGRLEWDEVKPLMEKYLESLPIDIYICEGSLREAEGAELVMVEAYNKVMRGESEFTSKLSEKQLAVLYDYGPIQHFFELLSIPGIKGSPYAKLFHEFYVPQVTKQSQEETFQYEQLSLF